MFLYFPGSSNDLIQLFTFLLNVCYLFIFSQNIFPNGSIQFHQVLESDLGTYRCHAENKHGADEEMFQLYVKGNE